MDRVFADKTRNDQPMIRAEEVIAPGHGTEFISPPALVGKCASLPPRLHTVVLEYGMSMQSIRLGSQREIRMEWPQMNKIMRLDSIYKGFCWRSSIFLVSNPGCLLSGSGTGWEAGPA
jgi:hypothetical protein